VYDYHLRRRAEEVGQEAYDIPSVIWWNNLERVMMAIDDLDCRLLLAFVISIRQVSALHSRGFDAVHGATRP